MKGRCAGALLTAVAGGSSVAAVGAVAMEGVPRLSTSASMLAEAGGTPGTHTDRQTQTKTQTEHERRAYCLSEVLQKVSQGRR